MERRVNYLEHEYRSDVDASQTKEDEFMLLQRAREDLARARAELAQVMRT
jgi:hypothetical protein